MSIYPVDAVNYEEAVSIVNRHLATGDLGFVARVVSHWHVIGLEGWIENLRSSGDDRTGVVILMPKSHDSELLSKDDFPLLAAMKNIVVLTARNSNAFKDRKRSIIRAFKLIKLALLRLLPAKKHGKPLYLLTVFSPDIPMLVDLASRSALGSLDVRYVILDEGVGTYLPPISADMYGPAHSPERRLKNALVLARCRLQRRMKFLFARGSKCDKHCLFDRHPVTHELIVNEQVAQAYRNVLSRGAAFERPCTTGDPRCAIILTSYWSETKQMSVSIELEVVKHTAQVLDRLGFSVFIKQHPFESEGKYDSLKQDCEIPHLSFIDKFQAIEGIYPRLRPDDIVVGFGGTGLVTANAIFGLKTYAFDSLLSGKAEVGYYYSLCWELFSETFGHIVGDFKDFEKEYVGEDLCRRSN